MRKWRRGERESVKKARAKVPRTRALQATATTDLASPGPTPRHEAGGVLEAEPCRQEDG